MHVRVVFACLHASNDPHTHTAADQTRQMAQQMSMQGQSMGGKPPNMNQLFKVLSAIRIKSLSLTCMCNVPLATPAISIITAKNHFNGTLDITKY